MKRALTVTLLVLMLCNACRKHCKSTLSNEQAAKQIFELMQYCDAHYAGYLDRKACYDDHSQQVCNGDWDDFRKTHDNP